MLIRLSAVILFISLTGMSLMAQDFSKVEIKTNKVSDKIYYLEGAGGNIGVCSGGDGVLIIDSQFAPLTPKIKKAINAINPDQIKYLVNTHWHGDHTGGNENLGNDGVIIIAQNNVRQRLSTDQFMKAFSREVKAQPKAAWPTVTFEENMQLHVNDESIMLLHVHNAHTDGDTFVWFPDANVLHMGDCFFKDRFPFIDLGSDGSVAGAIKAVETALMFVNNETKIIPGHGTLANKTDLLQYYTMLKYSVKQVQNAMKSEKTLEQIKAEGFDNNWESWGGGFISEEKWIDTIWTDLERTK